MEPMAAAMKRHGGIHFVADGHGRAGADSRINAATGLVQPVSASECPALSESAASRHAAAPSPTTACFDRVLALDKDEASG